MPKTALLTLIALTLAAALHQIAALAVLALPLLVAAALIGYRRSLIRRPYTTCRPCHGTGYRHSRLFAAWTGYCPDCTGTGHRPRPGVRLFNVR